MPHIADIRRMDINTHLNNHFSWTMTTRDVTFRLDDLSWMPFFCVSLTLSFYWEMCSSARVAVRRWQCLRLWLLLLIFCGSSYRWYRAIPLHYRPYRWNHGYREAKIKKNGSMHNQFYRYAPMRQCVDIMHIMKTGNFQHLSKQWLQ